MTDFIKCGLSPDEPHVCNRTLPNGNAATTNMFYAYCPWCRWCGEQYQRSGIADRALFRHVNSARHKRMIPPNRRKHG